MPRYRVQTPEGRILTLEGDHFPTEEELMDISSRLPIPEVGEIIQGAPAMQPSTFEEMIQAPPTSGRVIRDAIPGMLTPDQMRPAIRKIGGELAVGERGETHPDIIDRDEIEAKEIDQRGFVGPLGEFFDRESGQQAAQLPTLREPGTGRAHSTDLALAQAMAQVAPEQVPGMPAGFVKTTPEPGLAGELKAAALGAGAGVLQRAAPAVAKAFGALTEFGPSAPVFPGVIHVPPEIVKEQERRLARTGGEFAAAVAKNPFYRAGEVARAYWEKTIPRTESEKQALLAAPAEEAGAMVGYLAAGPAAPALIGAESFAEHLVNRYEELKENLGEERAGEVAMQEAMLTGGLQASVFAFLPKPLKSAAEKTIVERFGESGLGLFLGKRAGSSAQISALFGSAHIAQNLTTGRPPTEGLPDALVGGILFGAVTPYGKTRIERERRVERARRYFDPSPEESLARDAENKELQQQVAQRKTVEDRAIATAKTAGQNIFFSDRPTGGSVAITLPDGRIEVNRKNFHNWLDLDLKGELTPEAIRRMVSEESIHSAARTLPKGDERAASYWSNLTAFERWVEEQLYRFPEGTPDSFKGHEAIRRRIELMDKMDPAELLGMSMGQRWNYRSLELMSDAVNAIRQKLGTRASRDQKATLLRVERNLNRAKKGAKDAIKVEKAAAVYGDVRAPAGEVPKGMPTERRGKGILPQAEGRLPVAGAQEVLLAKAPPAAPAVGGPPAAPVAAPEVAAAKPAEAVRPPAAEPAIREPTARAEEVKPKVSPEEAELDKLRETLRERELTGPEMDRLDELMARRRAKGPAMMMRPPEEPRRRTLTPAVILKDGRKIIDGSHGDIFLKLAREGSMEDLKQADLPQNQVFVDETGKVLTRQEAARVFREVTGQEPSRADSLISEDLFGTELAPEGFGRGPGIRSRETDDLIAELRSASRLAPGGTNRAIRTGLAARSIADLSALAEEPAFAKSEASKAYLIGDLDKATDLMFRPQIAREAIEVATNTGSHMESLQAKSGFPLGERPLDWKNNPEVAQWLVRNAKRLGIYLPPEFRSPDLTGPAMRLKDMDEKQFEDFLRPIKMAAGDDPAKQEAAVRSVMEQLKREEQAEFEAKQPPETELGLGPEEVPTPTGEAVSLAMENYLASPITAQTRPSFRQFVRELQRTDPRITPTSIRWRWGEQVGDHLVNAPKERLSEWRKAMNLERRYGTREIANPPENFIAAELWEKMTKEQRAEAIANRKASQLLKFMEVERTSQQMESEGASSQQIVKYFQEQKKREENAQKYRRRLITEIHTRLAAEAMPEIKAEAMRREIAAEDIDFENASTRLGAYRTLSDAEASDVRFLSSWLDDESRMGKYSRLTLTKRITVLKHRTTGEIHLVSTYKHPTKGRGIMLYDPTGEPSFDKTHHQLGQILPRYKVVASILLKRPVEKFHMKIEADPETGRSADKVYDDMFGDLGRAAESGLDPIWMDFQHEIRAKRKGAAAAEEIETGVEEGEGGLYTGPGADIARASAGILRSNLKYFARGPMTTQEAKSIAKLFGDMEVSSLSDIKDALQTLSILTRQINPLTHKRRGLRGDEYCAISGIDKAVRKYYFELRQDPLVKERIGQLKDPDARKKYLEGVKMDAYYRALNNLYEIAETTKKEFPTFAETGPKTRVDFDIDAFATEALDRYGDHTRRAFESAAPPEISPPESGARTLLLTEPRPGVPRVRRRLLPEVPPGGRREPVPPEKLTREQQAYVAREAEAKYPRLRPVVPGFPFERPPAGVPPETVVRPGTLPGKLMRQALSAGVERPPYVPISRPRFEQTTMRGIMKEAVGRGPAVQARGYGVAQRVLDEMAAEGRVIPIDPGIGTSWEESVVRGRALLKQGRDPEQTMTNFEESGRMGEDDLNLARAWGEELQKRSDHAGDQFGRRSPEYRSAFRQSSLWNKRVKKMATLWARLGTSLQGETDVDTGSFTAMERDWEESTGRPFTPKQAAAASQRVTRTKQAVKEAQEATDRLFEEANKPEPMDPQVKSLADRIITTLDRAGNDALARIRKRRAEGRLFAIPAEDMADYAVYGASKMAKLSLQGALKFSRWSKEMIKDLGDYIKPHLQEIWDESQKRLDREVATLGPEPAYEPVRQALTRPDPAVTVGVNELRRMLAMPQVGKYTPQQARAIWNYVRKVYVDRGETDFDVIRHKTATDLGLSVKEVTEAMAASKTLKRMTDQMYVKLTNRRQVINEARNWLKNQKNPGWLRLVRRIPRVFFIDKVFGHGTVGLITHAGNMVFDARSWKVYFPEWIRMYRMVRPTKAGTAYHERMMQDLMNDPNYVLARRAGLQNNPFKYSDDYQVVALTRFFSKMIGNRGFDALKTLRQARFNQLWNGTPEHLKTPFMARLWADSVNHATGIVKARAPEWMNWTFFAPKLEGARWAQIVGDTYKSIKILAQRNLYAPEEVYWARHHVMGMAGIVGMYFALLAMNQGILQAIGSDQKINFTDPRKSDFWSFKVAGFKIGVVGPMIGMVRMFARIAHGLYGEETYKTKLETEGEMLGKEMFRYGRGKLSPFASFSLGAILRSDFQGRPLPWSERETPRWMRRIGMEKYTWPEYIAETAAPIPLEEAIRESGKDFGKMVREVWEGQGMNPKHIEPLLRGLTVAGGMAATGVRISEDVAAKR